MASGCWPIELRFLRRLVEKGGEKMRIIILVLLIIILALPVEASFSRTMSFEFDGDVEMESLAGNDVAESATTIEGEGEVSGYNSMKMSEDSMKHDIDITATTHEDARNQLEIVSGVKVNSKNIHLSGISPEPGMSGYIGQALEAKASEKFSSMISSKEVEVEYGLFQHYLEASGPYGSISERIRVEGSAAIVDQIELNPDME